MNSTTTSVNILIFTALALETSAVRQHLADIRDVDFGSCFGAVGKFEGADVGVIEVGAGNTTAAAAAAAVLGSVAPEIAAFVGVAGGIKDAKLGDVVVATKVYGYEGGKDKSTHFAPRASGQAIDFKLEQSARLIRQRTKWHDRIDFLSWGEVRPVLFVEPIAAGEKVVASSRSATAKFLKANFSDAIAVEMEGRGFLEAVRVTGSSRGVIVRGVSDLLSQKAQADAANWQPRAASAAAGALFEMLSWLASSAHSKPAISSHGDTAASEDHRFLNGRSDLLGKIDGVVQSKAPRYYSAFRDSVALAREAFKKADLATLKANAADEFLKLKRPKSIANGAPDPVIVREDGLGLAIWSSGDEYIGEMENKTNWGLGVYKIYAGTTDSTPDAISYFRGQVQPKANLGPSGVYEFVRGSLFAGNWRAQKPRRGYMNFVGADDPFDFYVGDIAQIETGSGNLWKPGGVGVGISLKTMSIVCGQFNAGLAVENASETFAID